MKILRRRLRYDAPEPVMRAAGAWLARRDRGLTAAEADAFTRWRSADPSHEVAVAQLEQTMAAFDQLRISPAGAAHITPNPDALAPPRSRHRIWNLAGVGGLAAVLTLLLLRPLGSPNSAERVFAADGSRPERVVLDDGSVLDLNRRTRLAVVYTNFERRVAANPTRPFVVEAGQVAARAVGTAFSVRLDAEAVAVLVTEGKVQVASSRATNATSDDGPLLLEPGDRAVVALSPAAPPPQVVHLDPAAISQHLAWQPRLLDVSNASLADLVTEFNRRAAPVGNPHLTIADPELKLLRIGGRIDYDQPETFVRLLEKSFGVRAERKGDVITLRPAR
jgi:transmembrane sensor